MSPSLFRPALLAAAFAFSACSPGAPIDVPASVATPPHAGSASEAVPNAAVLRTLELNHATIEKSFTVADGITGFAVRSERGRGVIYQVGDSHALLGTLFGSEGQNLTQTHNSEHVFNLAAGFQRMKEEAHTVVDTTSAPLDIWAMYEPHCPYCAMALMEFHAKGINVRWVPVMFLSEHSADVMAAVWAAPDPAALLREAALAKSSNTMEQFLAMHSVTADAREAAALQLRLQHEWMQLAGLQGTPSFIIEENGAPRVASIEEILQRHAPAQVGGAVE